MTGGSLVPMITQLMEERKLEPEEIERLREILEEG
ncbi:MAG: BlaI/MecI/CopY family transcriptional regulator [Gemmatimonadales bacterium]|nr:BlaI/MecI/CopY family transcriptional regulator [Gemmatimonadales bacterium]